MSVEFASPGPKLNERALSGLEQWLGFQLPAQYRQFLLSCNGGVPVENVSIRVPGIPGGETDLQVLFGVARSVKSSCIEWNVESLSERLEPDLLPIARDSGGNVFCLSMREGDRGSVVYG